MLTPTETETVLLKAVWDLIDEAVNRSMMDILGDSPQCEIRFHTSVHQRYFNIVLVDLLAETDDKAPLPKTSFLKGLTSVAKVPHMAPARAVRTLAAATEDFQQWLDQQVEVEAWLPSINVQAVLKPARGLFIRMAGNLSKHGFLRTYRVAAQLQSLLERAGTTVSLEEASLALADFYERFHTDILNYHASTLAEFLNNIRWGIYEYLTPAFEKSFRWSSDGPPMYSYVYPEDIKHRYAQQVYWDLMNEVRSPPYIPRFGVHRWVKLRY